MRALYRRKIKRNILEAIRHGDKVAFKELFEKYSQQLFEYSLRIVKDEQISKDTVQIVFINIWKRREILNSSFLIKSYLYKSVRNNSIKLLNAKENKMSDSDQELFKMSDGITPADNLEEKELYKAYLETIEKLPEKCREIFLLNKNDGFSYSEIAEILNISINTVKTQMGRAISYLRKHLSHFL